MEEILNRWNQELEQDVAYFTNLAVQVGRWDRQLLETGDKILTLHGEVQKVQVQQKELDSNLVMIESQQNDLQSMLDGIEKQVQSLYNSDSPNFTSADEERSNAYQLAEDVTRQLDQMSGTLKDMINKLNTSYESSVDPNNKITQIVQILNVHLGALHWIDQQTSELQQNIQVASKQLDVAEFDFHRR